MNLMGYKALVRAFLDEQIPVEEFEARYLSAFKSETEVMDEPVYRILDTLFSAVDAYWIECMPGEETAFLISEDQLRREAAKALAELERLPESTHYGI
jgi:hypothetical protein